LTNQHISVLRPKAGLCRMSTCRSKSTTQKFHTTF